MKILNWVHRRFNGPTSSVSLHSHKGQDVRMNNQEIIEMNDRSMVNLSVQDREETLLEWEDGFLAIGTLGFHVHHSPHPDFIVNPKFSFRQNSSNSVFESIDSRSDDQEEYLDAIMAKENDEKPLIYNAYNHQEIEEAGDEIIIAPHSFIQQVEAPHLHDISNDSVKSDRTTLADLFKADQNESVIIKKCSGKSKEIYNKDDKQTMIKQKKFPTSLSAKLVHKYLVPHHEVHPIKKINHMMRKIMKRKIHPAELSRHKSTSEMENHGMMTLTSNDEIQVNEVMALLQSDNMLAMS